MTFRGDDSIEPLRTLISIEMDRATSTATIVTSDGNKTSLPLLQSPFASISTIVRFTYLPSVSQLHLETDHGDTVVAELPTLRSPAPRGGRPVIYLDQKDWSLLANVLYEPTKVHSTGELDAAERLITLARETKVILPLSFGHLAETSKWTDTERRYRLAITMVALSRGWQMRYPLAIRRYELRQSFLTSINKVVLPPLDVFTLEGCAIEPESRSRQRYETQAGLPPEMAHAVDALTCISSYFGTVLDSEAVATNPIPGWASGNQKFTDWLASEPRTSSQKRKCIGIRFLADLRLEVIEAANESGISPLEMEAWLKSYFNGVVRVLPSLGLFNEVYHDKHLNPRAVWHINDLYDMMYLTCGSGYADYVVGDRSSVSHIRQSAKRLRRQINIYRRISDLIVALKGDGL